jgi:hypothetical protein
LLSTAYASTAVAIVRMSDIDLFCLPRCTAFRRFGMAMAARMPMIAMTISSSINVKPDSRFFIIPPSSGLLCPSCFLFQLGIE